MLIKKKKKEKRKEKRENLLTSGSCRSGEPQSAKKRKRKDRQILGPCQKTKNKAVEPEGDGDTSCNWYTWKCLQRFGKRE